MSAGLCVVDVVVVADVVVSSSSVDAAPSDGFLVVVLVVAGEAVVLGEISSSWQLYNLLILAASILDRRKR